MYTVDENTAIQTYIDIATTSTLIVLNGAENQNESDLEGSTNGSFVYELEKLFGEMWYVTLGAIGLILLLCCYCAIKKARDSNTEKNKFAKAEEQIQQNEGQPDETDFVLPDGLEPATNQNGRKYLSVAEMSPVSPASISNAASDGFPVTFRVSGTGVSVQNLADAEVPYPPLPAALSLDSINNNPGAAECDLFDQRDTTTATPVPEKNDQIKKGVTLIGSSSADDNYVSPMVEECETCGKRAAGRIDEEDDCFYCFQCWKKWTDQNGMDDLYKRATSATSGVKI